MNDVTSPLSDAFLKVLEQGLSDDCMARVKKQLHSILDDVETDLDYRMKDDMQANLTSYVQDMAEKAVDALLRGNDDLMCHYLKCVPGYYTGRDSDSRTSLGPVIHGKMFEYDPILLRREIVDAHADRLKNERILDLESQVRALVNQVNELERQKERLREQL